MNIKPMNDRVLVARAAEEKKTAGGIIIPDSAKEKPLEGNIIAAGPGRRDEKGNRIAMEVKKGDQVLFSRYAGTEIKVSGEERLIMKEDDILAILN